MVWPFKKQSLEMEEEEKTRRPSNSKFKQQKLPAWQPILTASTVLPVFFLIGVVFLPVGIGLLISSHNIKEKTILYSDHPACQKCKIDLEKNFKAATPKNCKCIVPIYFSEKWNAPIYFYYGLSNFYQNHRRYVRSRDDNQLHGTLSQSVNSNCKPFDKENGTAYAPCGAIANSMFNDDFSLYSLAYHDVPLTYKDIAWKSDLETKYRNPKNFPAAFDNYAKPKYWSKKVTELGESVNSTTNNGFLNQDFIVWMRVAAFPTFRKLWRKLDTELSTQTNFKNGLPFGHYNLTITYNFPVQSFGGKKRFIITTKSWIGGKNTFLGTAYIVVGCLCLIFGFVFLVIHMKVRTRPLSSS